MVEEIAGGGLFDDFSVLHNGDLVGGLIAGLGYDG
jgi:hypothetical protein